MKIVPQDIGNAYHIAIYTDPLVTKVLVNRRRLDGTLAQGVYKAIHTRSQASAMEALYAALRKLRRSCVDYIFVYSNDPDLERLRPGLVTKKKDSWAQIKTLTLCELYQYAQRGGWYYSKVKPDAIPATRDMVPE